MVLKTYSFLFFALTQVLVSLCYDHMFFVLQEILEEVRKELQKVKEEIIGGESFFFIIFYFLGKLSEQKKQSIFRLTLIFLIFPAFIQELQKRDT